MPSGSHGGSPGSHSSGGASFGGGSHSSGGRSSFGPRRGPNGGMTFFFFGRTYTGASGALAGALTFCLAFAAVISIAFGFLISSFNSQIKTVKTDYAYYQAMINRAKADPALTKTANVTDAFLGTGGKWYITYKYEAIEGYTYSVYTMTEATSKVGKTTQIAINKATVDSTTDSITMDFDGRSYKNDGDYIAANQNKKITMGVCLSLYGIILIIVIGAVVRFINNRNAKKIEEAAKKEKERKEEEAKAPHHCPYCRTKLTDDQTKGPNCGASVKK